MKYPMDFNLDRYRHGVGSEFVKVLAHLDGDWICHAFDIPMDRYYSDYTFQRQARLKAMEQVEAELGLCLIDEPVIDTGVVLNASLFGGRPQYHSNSTPVLTPVLTEPGDVAGLAKRIDAVSDEGLLHEGILHCDYWKQSQLLKDTRGRELRAPASAGTKGIATVCGQLCGVGNFLLWMMTDPEPMKELTALIGRTFMRYIRASRTFDGDLDGANLYFASDLSGLMSPEQYAEFCAPFEAELYREYAPEGLRFYHSDSNMKQHLGILEEIGVNAVNIGPMISTEEILLTCPEMEVYGQVPPVKVLWMGDTDLVVDSVRTDINDMKNAGKALSQLTVCTAGSINPGTPLENIRAMMWAAMEFGGFNGAVRNHLDAVPVEFDRGEMVNQIS